MERSQSILKSFVVTALLTGGLLGAGAALAQRAISNTNAGNDPTLERRGGTALVGCEVSNTFTRIGGLTAGGSADLCSVMSSGESAAAAGSLAAAYGGSSAYTLSLSNAAVDRASANGISSGGLFSLETGTPGVGPGAAQLAFQRQQAGDFLIAFSGYYPVLTGLANAQSAWSAYYLFDDVQVEQFVPGATGAIRGLMNFELFERGSFFDFDPNTNTTTLRPTRDYTAGLVVNQVSIYTLDRTPKANSVPESGSLALAGLGLVLLMAACRLRRGARA